MKALRIAAVVILIAYIINSIFNVEDKSNECISIDSEYFIQLNKLFKNFKELKSRTKYTWDIVSNADTKIGILYLEPYGDADRLRGYNGKIRIAAAANSQGKICGIMIGQNTETASFLSYIRKTGFFDKWNNLSLKQASSYETDAVTGATFSSSAIAHGIRQLAIKHSNSPEQKAVRAIFLKLKDFILILWIFTILFLVLKRHNLTKYRKTILMGNVVILGFLFHGLFSIEMLGKIANGNFMQLGLSAGFIGVLFTTWWYGKNIYCAWLCPFGSMQGLIINVNKKTKIKLSPKWQKALKFFRTLLFVAVLVLLLMDMGNCFALINPFYLFSNLDFKTPAVLAASTFLIIGFFINRPWCRSCCPVGELIDLSSYYSKEKLFKQGKNYV